MRLKLKAGKNTDVGRQREQNEDNVSDRIVSLEDGDHGLFIVADGMGGYKAGEVASQLAVDEINKTLENLFKPRSEQETVILDKKDLSSSEIGASTSAVADPDATVPMPKLPSKEKNAQQKTTKLPDRDDIVYRTDQLKTAIQRANKAILQYGEKQSSARGLGCTVTAALVENDKAYIANVGDSRTYLWRDKKLMPVTRDHSLVARLVEAHQIEREDVYTHPQRNLIYRSLGAGHKNIEVDTFVEILRPGDMLLLCSDGLWEMVHDPEMEKLFLELQDPQKLCDTLIERANANGGEDNITALVVQVSAY